MGDPTSNFRCDGVDDNLELSISITLPVANEALLRLEVLPLLEYEILLEFKKKQTSLFINLLLTVTIIEGISSFLVLDFPRFWS